MQIATIPQRKRIVVVGQLPNKQVCMTQRAKLGQRLPTKGHKNPRAGWDAGSSIARGPQGNPMVA